MNIVKTGDGRFIEVQGTAEADPFGRDALLQLLDLADAGINQLVEKQRAIVGHLVPSRAAQLESAVPYLKAATVMQLARTTIATPLGEMLALASDAGLCALEFVEVRKRSGPVRDAAAGQARLTRLNARLRRWFPPHEIVDTDTGTFARTRAWLATSTSAARARPRRSAARHARRRIREARLAGAARDSCRPDDELRAIAKQLGSAGASRAVGAANGANPIAIIVPCHRVIGSNGSLTGYGGGLDRKTWLL